MDNSETVGYGYFDEHDLPDLATEKNNKEQIRMCFEAFRDKDGWKTVFD